MDSQRGHVPRFFCVFWDNRLGKSVDNLGKYVLVWMYCSENRIRIRIEDCQAEVRREYE